MAIVERPIWVRELQADPLKKLRTVWNSIVHGFPEGRELEDKTEELIYRKHLELEEVEELMNLKNRTTFFPASLAITLKLREVLRNPQLLLGDKYTNLK